MTEIEIKPNGKFPRPCSRCDEVFTPTGVACRLCNNCLEKARKKHVEMCRARGTKKAMIKNG